jgi:hypothetical protein
MPEFKVELDLAKVTISSDFVFATPQEYILLIIFKEPK